MTVVGFGRHTGHLAGDGLPDGGAAGNAHLTSRGSNAGSGEAILLDELVNLTVVVGSAEAGHGRNGGEESALHFESRRWIRETRIGRKGNKKTAKGVKRRNAGRMELKERTKALAKKTAFCYDRER